MGMGIGDKIGNGKEWKTTCMGMGMAIIPMGINSHRRMQLCNSTVYWDLRVLLPMTTMTENNICDFLRKSKIKTYNIPNYYFSAFCTIKMHT